MPPPRLYNAHKTSSRAFLARADELLARFDHSAEVSSFFYAALELRYGIEARLSEYLDATLRALDKEPRASSEYVASKLLKRLVALNPRASTSTNVRIDSHKQVHDFKYEPISPRLASLHGQLGELLHYKFFANNEYWYAGSDGTSTPKGSLDSYRQLLAETRDELARALSGTLLTTPFFKVLVLDVLADSDAPETDA